MKKLFVFSAVAFFGLVFDRLHIFRYCLVFSALHEAGHSLVYIRLMKKLPEIEVSLFGFKMRNDVTQGKKLFFILLGGPLTNLFFGIYALISLQNCFTFDKYVVFAVNIIIFCVNILPVYYLDGGQALSLICPFYSRHSVALSVFAMLVLYVTLIYFTGIKAAFCLPAVLFLIYFVVNAARENSF